MKKDVPASRRSRHQRRVRGGYLYVAVLFTALLIASVTAAALVQSTAVYRAVSLQTGQRHARQLAESELHRLTAWMKSGLTWRDEPNDTYSDWRISGDGGLRHKYTDADGDLTDDVFDPLTITVHARIGKSEFAMSAVVTPEIFPHPVLDYLCTSTGDFEVKDSRCVIVGGMAQCGKKVKADNKSDPYIVATSFTYVDSLDDEFTIRGDSINGAIVSPPDDLIQPYVEIGTEIDIDSIPIDGDEHIIEDVVLSATSNPYGNPDPNGIYWIEATEIKIGIRNARLECTLAVIESGEIKIKEGVHWEHSANYAAALVAKAKIKFEKLEVSLDEATRSTNFNPASSPYRTNFSNSTMTDAYPTMVRGLVHSEKEIEIKVGEDGQRLQFVGALISKKLDFSSDVNVSRLPALYTKIPLGLTVPIGVQFVHGSIRRIESP